MTRTELTELIVQAQNGNNSALEQIYLLTYNSAFNKIHSSIKNKEDAEDVLQSCYLTVVEKIGELKDPESFEKWFNRIVANRTKDYQKKKTPVLFNESEYNALSNSAEENSDFIPHEHMDRRDNIEAMRKFISELSEKNRRIIEMHYMEEKSVSEIAEELGIPESTVKTRLFNGRNEIKKKAKISAKKILITILVLILLAVITAFAVSSADEVFSKILYKFHNTYADYQVDEYYLENCPETVEEIYAPAYIPENYMLYEKTAFVPSESVLNYYEYYRADNCYIVFEQMPLSSRGSFDSDDKNIKTVVINGYEVVCSVNTHGASYFWNNNSYIFVLEINPNKLPEEEHIKIIESVILDEAQTKELKTLKNQPTDEFTNPNQE